MADDELEDKIESAIRNMPEDHCRPDAPDDMTLPLCEHRAYKALCRAIESLKAKSIDPSISDEDFIFSTSEAFREIQVMYPIEVVREIIVVLAEHCEIGPCDCGATDDDGQPIDPYLCGGVFSDVLAQIFHTPPTM